MPEQRRAVHLAVAGVSARRRTLGRESIVWGPPDGYSAQGRRGGVREYEVKGQSAKTRFRNFPQKFSATFFHRGAGTPSSHIPEPDKDFAAKVAWLKKNVALAFCSSRGFTEEDFFHCPNHRIRLFQWD